MPRVVFLHPEENSGEVPANISLLEAAERLGVPLPHDCGGNASCSSCLVYVLVGGEHLSELDFDEQDLLDREALTEPYHRLGCQARILGDVMVQIPEQRCEDPSLGKTQQEVVEKETDDGLIHIPVGGRSGTMNVQK